MLWTPHKPIFQTKHVPHMGGQGKKGPFGPQKTLLGDPEVLGGQRVARKGRYQVKVCGEHESHPGGPIRGSWDQIWSPGALRGPQKGYFGPNWALLGPLWTQKGSDTRSKCVVTMSPTQVDQLAVVGTKSGSPRPTTDLLGPKKGEIGYFFIHPIW